MMIELLAVQATTTAALAFFVIKLRRELWPMISSAGPTDEMLTPLMRNWIRSVNVLVLAAPQFEVSKTVIKVRWLFTEELFLIHRFRVYYDVMTPSSRYYYKMWKAWLRGDNRYRCLEEKPRGFSRLHRKAIYVICYDMEDEKDRFHWSIVEIGQRMRKRKT